ncbi:MAG: cyanophycinase [Bacteroidia bacterium]
MKKPKGKLIIIGGHEDKEIDGKNLAIVKRKKCTPHAEILSSLISKIQRAHHIIEIIATASSIPDQMEEIYRQAYKAGGFTHVGFIRIEDETTANDPSIVKRIEYCHAVFFTGGDQKRLTSRLNGTAVIKTIKKKYMADEHFIVAGTSAGAMAIPQTIITGGNIGEALMKNDIKIADGFDFINSIIVDTHFIKRGRFARLAHAVALNPSLLGIGLGEDTALTISGGNEALCSGSGMVIIIDGNKISSTNIKSVDDCTPIVIENLKVHIIAEGSTFLLKKN